MKDWKDPKWWNAVIAQVIAILVLCGLFTNAQGEQLSDSAAHVIAAVAVIVTQCVFVLGLLHLSGNDDGPDDPDSPDDPDDPDINGTEPVPEPDLPPAPTLPPATPVAAAKTTFASVARNGKILCAILLATMICAPAFAEPPTPEQLLAKLQRIECCLRDRSSGRVSESILAEIRELRREQARLLAMIENMQRGPAAPTQPILYVLPQGGVPRYELPPSGGTPKFELAPGGAPKYELPPGGAPKYELPHGGTPKYELAPGGAPKFELPPAGATPSIPGMPPAGASGDPPQGFMRFTILRK